MAHCPNDCAGPRGAPPHEPTPHNHRGGAQRPAVGTGIEAVAPGKPVGAVMAEDAHVESAADRTTGASLVRGGMWTMVAFVLSPIFTLVVSIPAARLLGAPEMGRLSYMGFLAAAVAICGSLGLPTAVQRFMSQSVGADRPGEARALAGWGLRWGGGGALLGFAVIASMQLITYPDLAVAWWLTAAYAAFAILHSFVAQVLYSLQQWRAVSLMGLFTSGLTVVTVLATLLAGYGIVGMRAAEAVSGLVGLLGTTYLARRALRQLGPPARSLGRLPGQILRFSSIASLTILLDVFVNKRSELFFLQALSTDEQLAYYSVGFGVIAATMSIPQAVAGIVMPAVATLAGAGQMDRIRSGCITALRLMVHLTVPLAAVTVTLGPAAVRLLYGNNYATAGTVLAIIAPTSIILTATSAVAAATLAGVGKIGQPLVCGVLGLIVNVALNVVLIPRWDAVGASVANGAGQFVSATLIIAVASHYLNARWLTWRLYRTTVAAALVAVLILLVLRLESSAGLAAAVILAGATATVAYLVLGVSLRVLGASEGELLARAVESAAPRVGRLVRRMQQV
jgi:O-antigen/teichoic acid export membrane protein